MAALALAGPAEASDHPPDPDPAVHTAPVNAAAEREALRAEKQAAREQRLAEQKAAREQQQAELRERHERWLAEQRELHQQWQADLERRWQEYVGKVRCACQADPLPEAQPGTQPGPQPDQPADTVPVGQPAPVEVEQPKPVEPGKPSDSQPDTPTPDKPAPAPAPVDDIGWRDGDEWAEEVDQRWQERNAATEAMWEAVPDSDTPVLAAVGATVATVVQYPVVWVVDTLTDAGRPLFQVLDGGLQHATNGLRPLWQGLRCATAWLTVPLEPLLADTVRVVEGTDLLPDTLEPVLAVVVDPRPAGGGQPVSPTPDTPTAPAAPPAPSVPAGDGGSGGQPAPHKPAPDSRDDSTPQAVHMPAGGGASLDADNTAGDSADRDNQPGPGQPSTPANNGGNGAGATGLDGVTNGIADPALTGGARIHPADTVAASHTCPPPHRPA